MSWRPLGEALHTNAPAGGTKKRADQRSAPFKRNAAMHRLLLYRQALAQRAAT